MSASAHAAPVETGRLERIAYSAYFVGQNVVYMLIQTYLLMYYVSFLRLDPALVATIFLVVRIWDAVNDPMIGVLMDRFRFRDSRYKGWLNYTAVLMPAATFLLFLVPASASLGLKVVMIQVTYVVWDVAYTVSEVPIFAVSTTMTVNERERTVLLTLTQIGSVLGAALGVGIVGALLGDGVDGVNWLLVGGIPSLLALVSMVPQAFVLRERHNTGVVSDVPLGTMIRDVLRNDQHLLMMSLFLSQALLNAVSVFGVYVSEAFYGDPQLGSVTSVFSLLGIVILGIFTPMIVRRFGKKRYLEVAMLLTIALSIPAFFIPGDMAILAMLFLGLRTMTLVVTSLLRPMFTADCIEYGEHRTGVRVGASAFAIQTLFNKTGDAVGVSLGGLVMALAMFDEAVPLAQQSPSTINALQFWYVFLPMVMAAIMYVGPKLFYTLDEATVTELIRKNTPSRNEAG